MRNMSAWAIRHPVTPVVLFVVLFFMGVVAFIRLPINQNLQTLDLNCIPGQTDHTLHVIHFVRNVVFLRVPLRVVGITGILKNDDVAAPDFPLRQQRKTGSGCKDELVDQQVIADDDRILH